MHQVWQLWAAAAYWSSITTCLPGCGTAGCMLCYGRRRKVLPGRLCLHITLLLSCIMHFRPGSTCDEVKLPRRGSTWASRRVAFFSEHYSSAQAAPPWRELASSLIGSQSSSDKCLMHGLMSLLLMQRICARSLLKAYTHWLPQPPHLHCLLFCFCACKIKNLYTTSMRLHVACKVMGIGSRLSARDQLLSRSHCYGYATKWLL